MYFFDAIRKLFGPWLGLLEHHRPRPIRIPNRYYCKPPLVAAPVVSIVTPSFNQQRFLERTILSVLDQGYEPLEYIVQDGDSIDETPAILERFRHQLFHCESAKDRGQAHAINRGFSHSTGEIMAFLNSDDLLLPGALHYVAGFFMEHPEVDVVYGHRVLIDEHDREIGRWVLPPHEDRALLWTDYVPQETVFWRRRIWQRIGGALDESLHSALDWDLLLRFRAAGAKFVRLPRFLGAFRIHGLQKTQLRREDLGRAEVTRLRRRYHGRSIASTERRLQVLPYMCKHLIYQRLYQLRLLQH
jgi:glycosyltransferase involved in cell wall biosynthesis